MEAGDLRSILNELWLKEGTVAAFMDLFFFFNCFCLFLSLFLIVWHIFNLHLWTRTQTVYTSSEFQLPTHGFPL